MTDKRPTEIMTERQLEGWQAAIQEAETHVGYRIPLSPDSWDWTVTFQEEIRPGRGQAMNAIWLDGEYFVQIIQDVYGYAHVSVASMDVIHNSSDEECPCGECVKEREEED